MEEITQEYIDSCKNGKLCECKVCICSTVYTCRNNDDCKDCDCYLTKGDKSQLTNKNCHHNFICKNCDLSFDNRIKELGNEEMGKIMQILKERNFERLKYR